MTARVLPSKHAGLVPAGMSIFLSWQQRRALIMNTYAPVSTNAIKERPSTCTSMKVLLVESVSGGFGSVAIDAAIWIDAMSEAKPWAMVATSWCVKVLTESHFFWKPVEWDVHERRTCYRSSGHGHDALCLLPLQDGRQHHPTDQSTARRKRL